VLRDVDGACSRFREDSELTRLNACAGRETAVSPLLARAIDVALRAARLTGGDVDPTVGTAMRLAGYDVDFGSLVRDGGPLEVVLRAVPGWRSIRLNRVTSSVTFPAGVEIDLGATAKALASDLAAAAALEAAGRDGGVLVSLGGDIAVAGEPPPDGWAVQVSEDSADAVDPDGESIAIRGGGVASSSTRVRRWRRGGVEMHHIIDPRTGAPVDARWHLVTVVGDTCVDANTASTAAIVRGAAAPAWLESLGMPARLAGVDGRVVRVGGWPEPAGGQATA
ncbi:MAG TPA: FAD:protein FMN transferase, partial [Candidatus Dormibacteraeota bacterium]|nr:FAD:protein FMN transferase [Candidatus Dormibacteraeota bacterium]